MNFESKKTIKIILVISGIMIMLFELNYGFLKKEVTFSSIIFFIGLIIFFIGKAIEDYKLFLIHAFISLGIISLTFAIFLYPINVKSEEISGSIQPTIDYFLSKTIDDLVEQKINEQNSTELKITLLNNKKIVKIYSHNITDKQIDIITDPFNFTSANLESKKIFSKFLIATVYNQLRKGEIEGGNDIAIPLKSLSSQANFNVNSFESLDENTINIFCNADQETLNSIIDMAKESNSELGNLLTNEFIGQLCEDDPKIYINVLTYDTEITKEINTATISKDDVELIWENLDFLENVSYESKQKIISLALGFLSEEYGTSLGDTAIPLASISNLIPQDMKTIVSYDIFNKNETVKQEAIQNARDDCEKGIISISEICQAINLTDYNVLMKNFNNLTQNNVEIQNLSINITGFVEKIDSTEKVETLIDESTKYYIHFLILYFIFISLAIFVASTHKNEENNANNYWKNIYYMFSKLNLKKFLPHFILIAIIYYIITTGTLFEILIKTAPLNIQSMFSDFFEIPMLIKIIDIIRITFYITMGYFLTSLIVFGIAYYYKKYK